MIVSIAKHRPESSLVPLVIPDLIRNPVKNPISHDEKRSSVKKNCSLSSSATKKPEPNEVFTSQPQHSTAALPQKNHLTTSPPSPSLRTYERNK